MNILTEIKEDYRKNLNLSFCGGLYKGLSQFLIGKFILVIYHTIDRYAQEMIVNLL
jgi:hypothetical protein